MSIVTKGYGGQSLATWGYGELIIKLISPFTEIISAAFTKLNSKLARYTILDDTTAYFERIIAETSDDLVITPPDSIDLVVVPSVYASYSGFDRIKPQFNMINALDTFMERVISEEPIVQGFAGDNLDLQIIPTISINYEKSNGIASNHEISNKIETEFERIIAEEAL